MAIETRFPRILTKKVMGEGTYSRRALFCYFGQGVGAYSRKGVHLLEHACLFELIRYNVCSSENYSRFEAATLRSKVNYLPAMLSYALHYR